MRLSNGEALLAWRGWTARPGRCPMHSSPAYVSGVEVQFSNGTVQFNIAKSK